MTSAAVTLRHANMSGKTRRVDSIGTYVTTVSRGREIAWDETAEDRIWAFAPHPRTAPCIQAGELCGVMYRFALAKTPSSDAIMKPLYRTVSLPRDVARAQGSMSLDLKIDWTNNQYMFFILGWPRGFTGSE
ncbi:hypothetical protein B0H13DRAFT_1850961 [Mycena leptocephala]|nr:hypothetical protein B0H13DRAFT_1850961 [Mycena leptocephala]